MDGAPAAGGFVEPLDGQVEHRGDFVDEGARAARAAAVHAHVGDVERAGGFVGAEEDHLGVLTAELDGATRARVERLDGAGVGDDFLHERDAELVGDGRRAGAGERDAQGRLRKEPLQRLERRADAFGLACAVAFVRRMQQVMRLRVERADLRCCRADVDPDVDGGDVSHRCSSSSARRCGGPCARYAERVAKAFRSVPMVVYPTGCWDKTDKISILSRFCRIAPGR